MSKFSRYTPGFKWSELEFFDDKAAIAKECATWLRKVKAESDAVAKDIEADRAAEERERQRLIAESFAQHARDLIELKAEELDAKMNAAIEADRAEARRVFAEYAQKVQAGFKASVQELAAWSQSVDERLKEINRQMERSRLHDERMELSRRGVIRGRR